MNARLAAAALAATLGLTASVARADLDDWTEVPQYTSSPEHFGLELRVGIYTPTGLGDLFNGENGYFRNDVGPHLSAELHYFPFRLEYLGMLGLGAGFGWSQWDTEEPGGMAGDRNTFELFDPRAFIAWRIDPLDYYLDIPLVLTAKVGLDFMVFQTALGSTNEATGFAFGPRFAGKLSLVLDFLEPRAARQLDDEWGINHAEVFFEMYYSMAGELISGQLPVGGWGWAAGLGFTF